MAKHDLSTHFATTDEFRLVGVDIETLALYSLRPVIFQVGIVSAVIKKDRSLHILDRKSIYLDCKIQEEFFDRETEESTIEFHRGIRDKSRLSVYEYFGLEQITETREMFSILQGTCKTADAVCVNHMEFDQPRLKTLAYDAGLGNQDLWNFRTNLDVSTPYRFCKDVTGVYPELADHRSRHDAVLDAEWNVRVAHEFLSLTDAAYSLSQSSAASGFLNINEYSVSFDQNYTSVV